MGRGPEQTSTSRIEPCATTAARRDTIDTHTPLSRLVDAKSVGVLGSVDGLEKGARLFTRLPCRRRSRPPADVLVLVDPDPRDPSSPGIAAAESAGAHLVLYTSTRQRRARLDRPTKLSQTKALALGPGGAFWTPGWQIGLPLIDERDTRSPAMRTGAPLKRPRLVSPPGPPVVIATQEASFIAPLVAAATRAGLAVRAAVSTGSQSDDAWASLVRQVARLSPATPLVLVLQQSVNPRSLVSAARHTGPGGVVVLPLGTGTRLRRSPAQLPSVGLPISTAQLAAAVGWYAFSAAEQAIEAARLCGVGFRPRHRRVLAAAADTARAALLAQALSSAQVDTTPLPSRGADLPTAIRGPRTSVLLTDARKSHQTSRQIELLADHVDAVVYANQRMRSSTAICPQFGYLGNACGPTALPSIGMSALQAMGLMFRASTGWSGADARPSSNGATNRSPERPRARAEALLRSWPDMLCEHEVKLLLAAHGLSTPVEQLAESPAAAARIAGSIDLPVAVKPVGPALCNRQHWGAVVLNVSTVAGVRQAFRDVIHACRQHHPGASLRGVLVSQMVPFSIAWSCTLFTVDGAPFLHVAHRHDSRSADQSAVLPCPVGLSQARQAAQQICAASPGTTAGTRRLKRDSEPIARFIRSLANAGGLLLERLAWAHLDTVCLPESGGPPCILDARAKRS